MSASAHPCRTVVLLCAALALSMTACSSGSDTPSEHEAHLGRQSINVLMVGNSQMADIKRLTSAHFTKETGIRVKFTSLDENQVRARVRDDVANRTGAFDVVTIGAYEVPIWSKNGWLHELSSYTAKDTAFDVDDILPPMLTAATAEDGKLYGVPFYGESSMLIYRKDVLAAHHLTMPLHPTWRQVERIAAETTDRKRGVAGICLRGLQGWGEMLAPLTTVVNTFGGTWFDRDWQARVDAPPFARATAFYTGLIKKYGEPKPETAGFSECQQAMERGRAVMWYDATSGAGALEDPAGSRVAGKLGYAFAPVEKTAYSGWLWSWDWAVPSTTRRADAAWAFVSWASSKKYEQLVGAKLGWTRVPDGKRTSTFAIPEYQQATAPYYKVLEKSIQHADPKDPGLQPRPAIGIQFVGVAEFADLGDKVSRYLDDVLTGSASLRSALARSQRAAADVARTYRFGS